jgi:hypothetical protein
LTSNSQGLFMNREVQRSAAEVRRRYGRAAERRFWAGYFARELFDAGPYIFVGLIVVLLSVVASG